MIDNRHRGSLERLRQIYGEKLPFNRLLGLEVNVLEPTRASLAFDLRQELIGNYQRQRLHGGVIAAVLDTVGGLTASAAALTANRVTPDQAEAFLAAIGTVDLRVDFLRPGNGERFEATGTIVKQGAHLAVVHMALNGRPPSELIASGTGTYWIG
jgi:uncharacterized protein (TIGR00369 family)